MPRYLTVHRETNVDQVVLETRWTEIARDPRATWHMTLFNPKEGMRYCEWEASDEDVVKEIFKDLGIKYSEIIEVDVTGPNEWRQWQIESSKRMSNCWEIMNCGKESKGGETDDIETCPVATARIHHGKNRGSFAGRYCWRVVGTLCFGKVQNDYGTKMIECGVCPFFRQVKDEEGSQFVP